MFKLIRMAALALVLGVPAAAAEDAGSSIFSYNAFGSLGVVHSSVDQADFTAFESQPNGAGYTQAWSLAPDSRLGAQLSAQFTPQLSAVLQVLTEQNYRNSWQPSVEWLNLAYEFSPGWTARVGRIELPTLLASDFRKVGYAIPWVRPPVELYGEFPITHSDGVTVVFRRRVREATNIFEVTYSPDDRYDIPAYSLEASHLWSVMDRVEYGPALLNFSYTSSQLTLEPPIALFDELREFGPQGESLAYRYALQGKLSSILAVGASYDPGKWFATSEWSTTNGHSFVGRSEAWYVSGGYRIAKFTPYATYSAVTQERTSDPGLKLAALPAEEVGIASALNAGLNQLLGGRPVQRTWSGGARWDFAKNFDLKLQCDHSRLGPQSPGTLVNVQPGFRPGGTLNVFSAAIDFVF